MTVRSVVVLPAPLRPTTHTVSPAPTSSETLLRISLAAIVTRSCWICSSGIMVAGSARPGRGVGGLFEKVAGSALASSGQVARADDGVDQPLSPHRAR